MTKLHIWTMNTILGLAAFGALYLMGSVLVAFWNLVFWACGI